MKYRPFGQTGLMVSEICLGTMTFGDGPGFWKALGGLDQKLSTEIVARAVAAGVNIIDTANSYSEGLSETLLGQALRDLAVPRSDVIVATKVRVRTGPGVNAVGLTRSHILSEVEKSLKRLQTDYIDLYQIHAFDAATPIEETLSVLDNLVKRGLVRYIGCSNFAAWQIMKALGISERRGFARFESLQAYYAIAGRDLEREIVPLLCDQSVGLMVWSPLAGGFLSGKFKRDGSGPNDARRTTFDFPPVDKERGFSIVDAMQPIAAAHGVSVARIAIAWLLHQKAVSTVIIGAKNLAQIDDNIAASDIVLTPEQLAALNEASALTSEYPTWMYVRQSNDGRWSL